MEGKIISFSEFNSNTDSPKFTRLKIWLKFLEIGEEGFRKESEELIDEHYKVFPDCDGLTYVVRWEVFNFFKSVPNCGWEDFSLKPTYRIFKRNEFEKSLLGFKKWVRFANPRTDNNRNLYILNNHDR
jgi:hypothetical protein